MFRLVQDVLKGVLCLTARSHRVFRLSDLRISPTLRVELMYTSVGPHSKICICIRRPSFPENVPIATGSRDLLT